MLPSRSAALLLPKKRCRHSSQPFVITGRLSCAILRPGPTASSTLATDIRSRAELDVRPDDWPLPIPLIEERGHWLLTRKRAHRPLLTIGRNELSAIRTLLACVNAQRDYFDRTRQASGVETYATRLLSTPERRDGLYWPVAAGETESRTPDR